VTTSYAFAGDTATVTTTCREHEHTFTVSPSQQVTNTFHDLAADQVMLALGAERDACDQAFDVFRAADAVLAAHQGINDSPAARFSMQRRSWVSPTRCGSRCLPTLAHYSSPKHIAAHLGVTARDVSRALRWRKRNGIAIPESAFMLLGDPNDPLITTDAFRAAAARIAGPQAVDRLRRGGVRVEWVTALAQALSPATRPQSRSIGGLIAARNCDPVIVAGYLDEGITSYFHTYISNRIAPERAMNHWRDEGNPLARTLNQT